MWLGPFLYNLLDVCALIQVDYSLLPVLCDLDLEKLVTGSAQKILDIMDAQHAHRRMDRRDRKDEEEEQC